MALEDKDKTDITDMIKKEMEEFKKSWKPVEEKKPEEKKKEEEIPKPEKPKTNEQLKEEQKPEEVKKAESLTSRLLKALW
jgi:hypothetical protein